MKSAAREKPVHDAPASNNVFVLLLASSAREDHFLLVFFPLGSSRPRRFPQLHRIPPFTAASNICPSPRFIRRMEVGRGRATEFGRVRVGKGKQAGTNECWDESIADE